MYKKIITLCDVEETEDGRIYTLCDDYNESCEAKEPVVAALMGKGRLRYIIGLGKYVDDIVHKVEPTMGYVEVIARVMSKNKVIEYIVKDSYGQKMSIDKTRLAYMCGMGLVANCDVSIDLFRGRVSFTGTDGTRIAMLPALRIG